MDASELRAPWWRKPLCWAGMCETFSPRSDASGCWGECEIRGKRAGFVDRWSLRRYADAEARAALAAATPGGE